MRTDMKSETSSAPRPSTPAMPALTMTPIATGRTRSWKRSLAWVLSLSSPSRTSPATPSQLFAVTPRGSPGEEAMTDCSATRSGAVEAFFQ